MHSSKILNFSCGELPTELSAEGGNERHDMRVAYICYVARVTVNEAEINSEYHAPRKYRFMVLFFLAQDHE